MRKYGISHLMWVIFCVTIVLCIPKICVKGEDKKNLKLPVVRLPGHLQKLGSQGPSIEIDTVQTFLNTEQLFENYVFPSKPLLLKGVVKDCFAKLHWTDDYFLSLSIPSDNTVLVENGKKEKRRDPAVEIHFQKFVRQYNKTDQYMVESIPDFLGKDIVLPPPLQCEEIYKEKIVDAIMWFSSGGTKSVLHTDSVENFNCLYSGQKEFVLIDPKKYGDKVDLDYPAGAYSGVDVDRVDYEKYPGLAEVEFVVANMTAGDCIYIPFRWIHQVRSYNRNIAVNVWWEGKEVKDVDVSKCKTAGYDSTLTLDKLNFQKDSNELNIPNIKSFFEQVTLTGNLTVDTYYKMMTSDMPEEYEAKVLDNLDDLSKITSILDKNKDGKMTKAEVAATSMDEWAEVKDLMQGVEQVKEDTVRHLSRKEIYDLLPDDGTSEKDEL